MNARFLYFFFVILFINLLPSEGYAAKGGEEYAIITKGEKKGMVNKKGRVVIPAEYEDLGWTNGSTQLLENVIGFKKDGLWGILNTRNEKITEPLYTSLSRFNESWIVASKKLPYNSDEVYGVINAKGKAVVPFRYPKMTVHKNCLIVMEKGDNGYFFGLLNEKGKPVIPPRYEMLRPLNDQLYEVTFHENIAVFSSEGRNLTGFALDSAAAGINNYIITYRNGKQGLVSLDGTMVIAPEYKKIVIGSEGIKAQKFREWQAWDKDRNLLASYAYDEIIPAGREIYKVKVGEAQALIHASDSLLTPFSDFDIREHLDNWILVKTKGKSGVLKLNGDLLLPPEFDSVRLIHHTFLVKSGKYGRWGWSMISTDGKVLTDQVYEAIDWLGDSFFEAKRGNYWGVLNTLGKEIIFCKYDSIVQYTEGKLLVKFLGEDGILNLDGEWEILPQKKSIEIVDPMRYLVRSPYGSYVAWYPDTKDFSAEYFLYKHGDRYIEKTLDNKIGLRDEHGDRIIEPAYDEISELQEDSIYYARAGNKYTFITKSGVKTNADDPRFQAIRDMKEAFIGVKIDGKWGFVDINGKLRIANQYENIGFFHEGLAPIKIRGRWGYVNKREEIIVQPAYDTVYNFQNGLCRVVKKGYYGLINAQGQITLDCEYDELQRLKTGGFLTKKNNKYGLAGKDGRLLILPRFDWVEDLNNGYVIASRKGKYTLLSNEGVDILPMIYDAMLYDAYNDVYLAALPAEWVDLKIPLNP